MDAIIVIGGTAEEIAALAVGLQERQGTGKCEKEKSVSLTPGESFVLDLR